MNKVKLHWIPERKFLAGGIAGILTWLVTLAAAYAGVDLPAETIGPLIVSAASAAYYLIPPSAQDIARRIDGDLKTTFRVPDVRGTATKLALAFLLLGGLTVGGPIGCATYEATKAEAATPAQRLYALQADYNTALQGAVAYAESPLADPGVVDALARLDTVAVAALHRAQAALKTGDSAAVSAAIGATQAAIYELTMYLAQHGGGA